MGDKAFENMSKVWGKDNEGGSVQVPSVLVKLQCEVLVTADEIKRQARADHK